MKNLSKTYKSAKKRKTELFVMAVLVFEFAFPHQVVAIESLEASSVLLTELVISEQTINEPEDISEENLMALVAPIKEYMVVKTYTIPITAYSSTVDQTDSTPCITANGFNLCKHNQEDIIAANFLPFGTKVRIPEHFGERIFTVQDRMNARYYYRADLWMRERTQAVAWGIKYTKIEVVE